MNLHLILLIVYSLGVVGLGVLASRFVRGSSDFFVGGRSLGPALLMSSMLAANIGAASTVGVAGKAYQEGISAWWWVGSAGIGSLLFAFTVAPALWRLARAHQFYTTGDYLEFRYGAGVRTALSIVICLASLMLLAGQLLAGARGNGPSAPLTRGGEETGYGGPGAPGYDRRDVLHLPEE